MMSPRKHPTAGEITSAVCQVYAIGIAEFRGDGRMVRFCDARCVAVVLARTMTAMSYPEIQRSVLLRDTVGHSTAVWAWERYWRDKDDLGDRSFTMGEGYEQATATLDRWIKRENLGTGEQIQAAVLKAVGSRM